MSSTAPVVALVIWICSFACEIVPVECVQGDVVRLAVGQIHIDAETGGRIPGRGDPAGAAGILQSPRVSRAGSSRRWSTRRWA